MARKTNKTAKNSGPKGPVVIEDNVEDAVEVTDAVMPEAAEMSEKADSPADPLAEVPTDAPIDAGPTDAGTSDEAATEDSAPKDAEEMAASEEPDQTPDPEPQPDVVEDVLAEQPAEPPEPAPVTPPPAPAPQVTVQKVGFVPLVLGGVIAAALGFGVAWYYFGQQGAMLSGQMADQSAKIAELEERVAAIPTEPTDLSPIEAGLTEANETIASLSARVDEISAGISAEVAAFEERVTAVERAPGVDGTLAATAIASWEQELDGLRAEIAAQQGRMQDIATDAEAELEAARAAAQEVEQNAAEAAEQAVVRAALARIQVALDSGTAFDAALADLTETGTEAPAILANVAAEGVPTITDLNESFPEAARAALAAARSSGEADADTNPITAFLRNQLDVRSVAPREGDDPDAILSRAGAALSDNRLTDALAEIASLPEVARAEMTDWIGQAEARAEAMAAVETLDQSMNN